jgi:hypothetical protein
MNAPYKIDVSKGELVSTVSQQWASRPDDEKFLSLSALRAQVAAWADESECEDVTTRDIEAIAGEHPQDLTVKVKDMVVNATHYSFSQVASIAGAPAEYLRRIPAELAALNLNFGLRSNQQKDLSAYVRKGNLLRGITSPKYGRIYDRDVVDEVMKLAGDGVGDTRWKVPGTIEWGSAHGVSYNPKVDITKENTTLYASDRDIFLFLVDDTNPIEVGKLADGSPDLMFRGFYLWNSEVGYRTYGLATMYLRGVCQNRNLWGVEGFSEMTFKHTAGAPQRFMQEAAPALLTYAEGNTSKLVTGVATAKAQIVSTTDEERADFLARFGFSERQIAVLCDVAEAEEGRRPESVWDHAQAVSAMARRAERQEDRLAMEAIAGKMLNKVKA